MVSNREVLTRAEIRQMPTPGTLAHLEYLRDLKVDNEDRLSQPHIFLTETMAATSLARVIRRHRTYWPMRNMQTADLDSRLLALPQPRSGIMSRTKPRCPGIFRGTIGLRSNLADHNHLMVYGQPNHNYAYNLVVPVTRAHIYDSSRPAQAAYHLEKMGRKGKKEKLAYNEMAAPEYREDDPQIIISVVQEAASDLLDIFHSIYGESAGLPELRPSTAAEVAWRQDYMSDDPDEFMTGDSFVD